MYTYISISYTYLFTELWLISLFGLFTYQYIDPQARVHCVFICLLFQVFSDFVAWPLIVFKTFIWWNVDSGWFDKFFWCTYPFGKFIYLCMILRWVTGFGVNFCPFPLYIKWVRFYSPVLNVHAILRMWRLPWPWRRVTLRCPPSCGNCQTRKWPRRTQWPLSYRSAARHSRKSHGE